MPAEKQLDINMESDLEFKSDHIPNSLPPMSNTDNTLPEELQKQIDTEATNKTMKLPANNSFDVGYMQGMERGYIAGATEYAPYKVKYERLLKIYEEDTKRNMRLNMPGVSEIEQEETWQNFKRMHNL